jgi:ribonuclease VapC
MIVLDSSSLLAILLQEPDSVAYMQAIAGNDCMIGAPTFFEAQIAAAARAGAQAPIVLRQLLADSSVEIVDFNRSHVKAAYDAFDRYGRGRHPAKLNFGDCMAYAVAKLANAPLLFKGDDFALTDIQPAFPQGPK